MKKLFMLLLLSSVALVSCDKGKKEAEYIISVTGDDYSDDLYILHKNFSNFKEDLKPLSLSGGEATIIGYRKCKFEFIFKPYVSGSNPYPPQHQTEGDVINITIFQKKKNGSKGDKVGELSMTCTGFDSDSRKVIEVEW